MPNKNYLFIFQFVKDTTKFLNPKAEINRKRLPTNPCTQVAVGAAKLGKDMIRHHQFHLVLVDLFLKNDNTSTQIETHYNLHRNDVTTDFEAELKFTLDLR